MSKRIGVLTAIAVLAFPALAGARIVVDQSIAGVSLGESMSQVRTHLGAPSSTPTTSGHKSWLYKGRSLLVVFGSKSHVLEVFTANPSQKTGSGVGVGSSEAAVKSHIRGVTCAHVPPYTGQECVVGVRHGSSTWATDFHIGPKGHVQNVLVNILSGSASALDRALRAG